MSPPTSSPEAPLSCFPAGRWLLGSLVLAAGVLVMVVLAGRLVGDRPAIVLQGAFAAADASAITVRFVDADRALVRADGQWREAFYRIERNHVVLETVPDSGRAQVWTFAIVGDRLVDHGVTLARR